MVANILFPVLETIGLVEWNQIWFFKKHGEYETALKNWAIFMTTSQSLMWVCQIISGVLLMQAIYRIRSYLREHGEDAMSTARLTLHACAFGFYLISVVGISVFRLLNDIVKERYFKALIWSAIIYIFLSFVSQVLLCCIFWDLGTKQEGLADEIEQDDVSEDFASVAMSVWDEEAEY